MTEKQKTLSTNIFIQERDELIFKALSKYRYLTTGQIEELFFSSNKSRTACIRRLKLLSDFGYINYTILQNPETRLKGENCYFIDKKGFEQIGTEGYFYKKNKENSPLFLLHAIESVKFRIKAEKDIQENTVASMIKWINEFDMNNPQATEKEEKYFLFNYVGDPLNKQRLSFNPDDLFILQGLGEYHKYKSLYFVEIDRGTEDHIKIRKKVRASYLFLSGNNHKQKYSDTDSVKILFITTSTQRTLNIINSLKEEKGIDKFYFTDFKQIKNNNIFSDAIWLKSDGQVIPLIK